MEVEVLLAVRNQQDLSLVERVGIHGSAVIANQADRFDYLESSRGANFTVRMITTPYKGVGRNRNTALLAASGGVCLFADEDETLVDDYASMVSQAFAEVPDADMLVFNLETIGENPRPMRANSRISRVRIWNALNYGTPRLAVRREALNRANVWFTLIFGAGAPFSAGSDSKFIVECLRAGLKIYTYPRTVGFVRQSTSTWFIGYTDKYFRDRGAFFRSISPVFATALCLQDAVRHRAKYEKEVSWPRAYRLMREGARTFVSPDLDIQ